MRWLYPCDLGLLSERFQASYEVVVPLMRWNSNQLSTNEAVVLLMDQASDEVVVPLKALSLKHLSTDEVVVFLIL
jgi:hypothetical protein